METIELQKAATVAIKKNKWAIQKNYISLDDARSLCYELYYSKLHNKPFSYIVRSFSNTIKNHANRERKKPYTNYTAEVLETLPGKYYEFEKIQIREFLKTEKHDTDEKFVLYLIFSNKFYGHLLEKKTNKNATVNDVRKFLLQENWKHNRINKVLSSLKNKWEDCV